MPTSKDIQANRPLAGHELKEILIKDFTSMLNGDGMFSAHMGYRRVGYEISIKLHVDNPLHPEHNNKRQSKDPARNAKPEQQSVVAPPIKDASEHAVSTGIKRERTLNSPNAARIEFEMPITIQHMDTTTGQVKERAVQYDKQGVEPSPVRDTELNPGW